MSHVTSPSLVGHVTSSRGASRGTRPRHGSCVTRAIHLAQVAVADLLTWAESPTGSVGPTACGGLDQPLQVTVTVVAQGGLGQPPVGPPAHHNAGAMVRRLAYRLASQQRAGHLSAQRERERREREEREREERERRALPSVSAAADQNGQAGRQAGRQRDRERERKTEKERGREREWRHTNTQTHRHTDTQTHRHTDTQTDTV